MLIVVSYGYSMRYSIIVLYFYWFNFKISNNPWQDDYNRRLNWTIYCDSL